MKSVIQKNLLIIFLLTVLDYPANCQVMKGDLVLSDEIYTLSQVKNKHELFVTIPEDKQNLSSYLGIGAMISNSGDKACRVEGYLNDVKWVNSCIYLAPGEQKTMEIVFRRTDLIGTNEFPGMKGLPGGTLWLFYPVKTSQIQKITFVIYTSSICSINISDIKPYGEFTKPEDIASQPGFFPFIDKYGQYKYDEWPGKTHTDSDLKASAIREINSLKSLPGPSDRDQYGGWQDGPKLKATGHFRTEKIDGKWWLITPEGNLFWSNGINSVRYNDASTRVEGREHFYEDLPDTTGDYSFCYGRSNFNFSMANLFRKYGSDWKNEAIENILIRLKSWGLNSLGNWSSPEIYLNSKNHLSYTVNVSSRSPRIDGKSFVFPDVFDPLFRQGLSKSMSEQGALTKDDPFCIGYFVDNELNVINLTQALMNQSPNGFAKTAFINFLKEKYGSVRQLNKAWDSNYRNWSELASATQVSEPLHPDFQEFDNVILDIYYSICREEVKRVAPYKLYLGSRLHYHYYHDDPYDPIRTTSEEIIRIAGKYCDVISFNRYNFSVDNLELPENVDKPVIIGEFHSGALDRGHFHVGIRSVANQEQRAEAYYHFMKGALENNQIVGAHWFQYSDQAFTARSDGENFQIGFVDICDTPYPEIIKSARQIGYKMYIIRSSNSE